MSYKEQYILLRGIAEMEVLNMTDHVYSISEIKNLLFPIFVQYEVNKAILFGSYSKEKATETSDVDLLVDSGLHGLKFLGLSEDIRTALDKDADVFDVSHIEPQSRIDNEIKDTGVVLYEK